MAHLIRLRPTLRQNLVRLPQVAFGVDFAQPGLDLDQRRDRRGRIAAQMARPAVRVNLGPQTVEPGALKYDAADVSTLSARSSSAATK